jgi:hypothetical protein
VADAVSSDPPVPQVLSEIQAGDGLSLSAAGRLFPAHRGNGTVDPSTVWRWARKGSKAPDGRLVRLEVCRVGGRWLTSRSALARFISALSAAAGSASNQPTPPAARTPTTRRKSSEHATRELERRGA